MTHHTEYQTQSLLSWNILYNNIKWSLFTSSWGKGYMIYNAINTVVVMRWSAGLDSSSNVHQTTNFDTFWNYRTYYRSFIRSRDTSWVKDTVYADLWNIFISPKKETVDQEISLWLTLSAFLPDLRFCWYHKTEVCESEIIQMRVIKSDHISDDKIVTNYSHNHYHLCTALH